MPLPGLGQDGDDEGAPKPFNPEDLGSRPPMRIPGNVSVEDDLDQFETYSIADSAFFDCLENDQVGTIPAPLPTALTPRIGLKFRTFDARIEAKYGVRNYIREIANFYGEIDENIAALVPTIFNGQDPLRAAVAVVNMFSEAHVYDVQVRRTKNGGRQSIYIRSIEPRPCDTRVVKFESGNLEVSSEYEENLLVLVQRELRLAKNAVEVMGALQPVAFTYHAMLRLWERGHGDGQTFHAIMAEAFQRLRGISALVELCHLSKGCDTLPPHIAIPVLDGFLVASSRDTIVESDELRWGFKRHRNWLGVLDPQDREHFALERYTNAKETNCTTRRNWFAATFMGANDIGAWERIAAARQFNELIEGLNLDEVARLRESAGRQVNKLLVAHFETSIPSPERVIKLQSEMLPRVDARDERWHLINL